MAKGKDMGLNLNSGCKSQKLGNSSSSESQPFPGSEAGVLKRSKSLLGTAAIQAVCSPYVLCSSAVGKQAMTQQDTSRTFRAAGHMDPRLSPGIEYQKPDCCSVASHHRSLRPLPNPDWALLFAGNACRPCSPCRGKRVLCSHLSSTASLLLRQGSPHAEFHSERAGSMPGPRGFCEHLNASLGRRRKADALSFPGLCKEAVHTAPGQGQEENPASRQPDRWGHADLPHPSSSLHGCTPIGTTPQCQ